MFFRYAIVASIFLYLGAAQTLVDVRTQTKDIDFSAASSTKPFKSGTTLPASCAIGEAFFKTNAAAGSNVYVCASLNAWTLEVGIPGPTGPQGPAGATGPPGPAGPPGAIGRIQNGGTNLPLESVLNFTSAGCTDDPANGRTDCNGAGISGVGISVNGSALGTQPTLNFISGNGIVETCANNSGVNRVDCTPAVDTAVVLSRSTDQSGMDHFLSSSSNSGTAYTSIAAPTLLVYTPGAWWNWVPDVPCAANPTININTLGPIPLKTEVNGTLTPLAAGQCQPNTIYELILVGSPVTAAKIVVSAPEQPG